MSTPPSLISCPVLYTRCAQSAIAHPQNFNTLMRNISVQHVYERTFPSHNGLIQYIPLERCAADSPSIIFPTHLHSIKTGFSAIRPPKSNSVHFNKLLPAGLRACGQQFVEIIIPPEPPVPRKAYARSFHPAHSPNQDSTLCDLNYRSLQAQFQAHLRP